MPDKVLSHKLERDVLRFIAERYQGRHLAIETIQLALPALNWMKACPTVNGECPTTTRHCILGYGWDKGEFAMRVATALALAGVLLGGCGPKKITTSLPWNEAEAAWAEKEGPNSITGFAVLRTVGGEARTCAGSEVVLAPDTAYVRERILAIYGSTSSGARAVRKPFVVTNTDTRYLKSERKTICDGQGNFTFEKLPEGSWFVGTVIFWAANPTRGFTEGGYLMKRVETKGGAVTKVTLP